MKKIIKKVFNVLGFNITKFRSDDDANLSLNYEYNDEAFEHIKLIRGMSMVPYINLVQLYEMVKYIEEANIEGDLVECGVWKGGAAGLMAIASKKYASKKPRRLHLFDVFDDICEPDPKKDGERAIEESNYFTGRKNNFTGKLTPIKGFYDKLGGHGTVDICKDLLFNVINYPEDSVKFHVGWFQETMPLVKDSINKISILRLDGDWYESTKFCLEYLYDKVQIGGLIIIDDYGTYDGCKKAVNEFLDSRNIQIFLSYSSTDCRYWVKN